MIYDNDYIFLNILFLFVNSVHTSFNIPCIPDNMLFSGCVGGA